MEGLVNYLKRKVAEKLYELVKVEEGVRINAGAVKTLRQSILDYKGGDEKDKSYNRVRSELITMQENHYYMYLMNQHAHQLTTAIKELGVMAQFGEVDLELEGELKDVFGRIMNTETYIFMMKNGEPELSDSQLAKDAKEALNKKLSSEEGLKALYDSF